ncbi:YbaY family lipoprotein [Edaphobacter flagellatus]|uniref:YbaY family lipoprotein n=1 Tax=Edaphobacter flagellatus TaxID=1933044 RepID=UPI0021B436CE|nr:YbaY family lipoprotein [Edaphobacter flagellatus]
MIRIAVVVSMLTLAAAAPCQTLQVTGTATYRERMALPPNAIFEATLEDVSLADAPATVIGNTRLESPGNPPFQFSISYDSSKIVPNHTYAVRAQIKVDKKLWFTTDQRYAVLTQGHGSEISMMMLRRASGGGSRSKPSPATAQAAAPADEPLRETYWKLMELRGKPVNAANQQQEAHLVFRTGDRLSGSGGCNRLMGGYSVEGNTLHFKGIGSTMMACAQGMDIEQAFLAALNKVETWKITNNTLELYDSGAKLLAKFEARAMK